MAIEKRTLSDEIKNQLYSIAGKVSPNQYQGVFKQGYESLGQPNDPNFTASKAPIIAGGVQSLANNFVEQYYQKFGTIPDEEAVSSFVSQNLTPTFAKNFIQGIPGDTITGMAKQYISDNEENLSPAGTTSGLDKNLQNLKDQTAALYGEQRNALTDQVNQYYGQQKQNLAEDLAAQGMTRQPVSRYSLDALTRAQGQGLTQGLSGLAGQQASGNVDLANTLAQLQQQSRQFGQDLGLRRQAISNELDLQTYNQGLARQQLGLASELGRARAEAGKPGTLDYINTGVNVATGLANLKKAFSKS